MQQHWNILSLKYNIANYFLVNEIQSLNKIKTATSKEITSRPIKSEVIVLSVNLWYHPSNILLVFYF